MPSVSVKQSLKAGVQNWLKETWRQVIPVFKKQQELFMKDVPFSNIRNVSMVFKESLPFPSLWDYGTPRSYSNFQDRIINIMLIPFSIAIKYSHYDELDDQIGDIKEHIEASIKRFGQLPDVLVAEYFNGSAVLNPSLALTYDGASLFSATDGAGENRLGVSGGNIISGTGLTPAGFIHDLSLAQRRFMNFVDPVARKPIFDPSDVDYKMLEVVVPTSLNEIVQKVSGTEYIHSDNSVTVPESNWVKGTFKFHVNPYLTDTSDWYVVARHPYWKPFVNRAPKDIESILADKQNSDSARETNEYAFYADTRTGIAPYFPGCIIKVNY